MYRYCLTYFLRLRLEVFLNLAVNFAGFFLRLEINCFQQREGLVNSLTSVLIGVCAGGIFHPFVPIHPLGLCPMLLLEFGIAFVLV